MLGVGSDLVEPQLATGQHLNGELLSKIYLVKRPSGLCQKKN